MRTNIHRSTEDQPKVGALYDDYDPTDQKGVKKSKSKRSSAGYLRRHSRPLSEDTEGLIANMQDQTEVEITVSYHGIRTKYYGCLDDKYSIIFMQTIRLQNS